MNTSRTIDLNADLGEGFPFDLPLLARVSSANVCCGAHAGDESTMMFTLSAARDLSVVVGAHPGYDDREHFGRRELNLTRKEIVDLVLKQLSRILKIAAGQGVSVRYVKPHGALYNQAQRDMTVARAMVDAIAPLGLPIVGQPGSVIEGIAGENRLRFIREGFIDRRYANDGRLVARTEPNAILTDPIEIEDQIFRLIDSGFETLCIPGDDPRAVESADMVLRILDDRGVTVQSFLER
ncbi:MAG: 5-oxoprolinase subunit PxpA [Isosphaeraceae bacterium]